MSVGDLEAYGADLPASPYDTERHFFSAGLALPTALVGELPVVVEEARRLHLAFDVDRDRDGRRREPREANAPGSNLNAWRSAQHAEFQAVRDHAWSLWPGSMYDRVVGATGTAPWDP